MAGSNSRWCGARLKGRDGTEAEGFIAGAPRQRRGRAGAVAGILDRSGEGRGMSDPNHRPRSGHFFNRQVGRRPGDPFRHHDAHHSRHRPLLCQCANGRPNSRGFGPPAVRLPVRHHRDEAGKILAGWLRLQGSPAHSPAGRPSLRYRLEAVMQPVRQRCQFAQAAAARNQRRCPSAIPPWR